MSKNTKVHRNVKANKNVSSKNSNFDILYLLPILFVIAVVPIIVQLKVVPLDSETFRFWNGRQYNEDFFSYYKALFISWSGLIATVLFFVYMFRDKNPIKPIYGYYIPIGIYAFFIIVSTAISTHPLTAKNGFADRYEGVYILLSYLILLFVTINLVKKEKHAKVLISSLIVSAVIIGTIGIFQYFGLDLFKSHFGKTLIIPSEYQKIANSIDFTFLKYTIYSTLYNTNFVGSYMAMLFPLSFTLFILTKKHISKIAMGLVTCLMFANLIGCRSRAGLVGTLAAFFVLLIITRKRLIPNIIHILSVVSVCIVLTVIMNNVSSGDLIGRLKMEIASIGNENNGIFALMNDNNEKTACISIRNMDISNSLQKGSINYLSNILTKNKKLTFTIKEGYSDNEDLSKLFGRNSNTVISYLSTSNIPEISNKTVNTADPFYILDIKFSGKLVSVITLKNTLNIKLEDNQIGFYNENNNPLDINKDEAGNITLKDGRYIDYKLKMDPQNNTLSIYYGDKFFVFLIHPTGFKMVGERGIIVDDIDRPESIFFNGKEKLGSSRGYIWSRSIPLLKKYIFAGCGPDNYAFTFPQHDYVGKLNGFGTLNEIVDKPHNMYLQIGINTGVMSLLAILVLFGFYLITCIRLYFKGNFENSFTVIGGAIFTAITGYLGAAFFNDSLVSVAPVFWVLLGLGICCNYMISEKKVKA